MNDKIAVQDLCVGMYVHLDLGWMRHPFPLSSFRIVTQEQIDTIRKLGLSSLRWVPEKSELAGQGAGAEAGNGLPRTGPADETPTVTGPTPAEREAALRRAALRRQREAATLCERQYLEAGQALRGSHLRALTDPVQAREDAEALTRALVDKMLTRGETCVRLLTTCAGDRASTHALNVTVISLLMARRLEVNEDQLVELGVGALMHDIGKLEMAERLRHVDEHMTASELAAYQEHVAHGLAVGQRMGLGADALAVIAQHHEAADGSGFPARLGGDRINQAARIVAIVNRYDNLCNPVVLARAITPHEALSLLFAQQRSRFDATVLNAFIRMMGVYPAGSVVQLTDDRFALVMAVNSMRPLKPRVLVHDPAVPRDEALLLDLETVPELGIRRSLNAAKLPRPALDYLAPRPRVNYFFEPIEPQDEDRQ